MVDEYKSGGHCLESLAYLRMIFIVVGFIPLPLMISFDNGYVEKQPVAINPFPNKPCLQYKSLENTVGKGEIARNEQFLLFPQHFLHIWITFCHFHQIKNCWLQTLSVWQSLNFVVWERVNLFPNNEI